jgi:hypothetical protein
VPICGEKRSRSKRGACLAGFGGRGIRGLVVMGSVCVYMHIYMDCVHVYIFMCGYMYMYIYVCVYMDVTIVCVCVCGRRGDRELAVTESVCVWACVDDIYIYIYCVCVCVC